LFGSPGPIGIQGAVGWTGASGPAGEKGFRGPAGFTGPLGQPGSQGSAGDVGPQGGVGQPGDTGTPGIAGLSVVSRLFSLISVFLLSVTSSHVKLCSCTNVCCLYSIRDFVLICLGINFYIVERTQSALTFVTIVLSCKMYVRRMSIL